MNVSAQQAQSRAVQIFQATDRRISQLPLLYFWVFIAGCAVIASRRPDAIFNPQFWAEDGAVWYADAYNRGLHSLFSPQAGYFQTLPRLVALLSQALPLILAPLMFNCAAIVVQILPAILFISPRFSKFGTTSGRLLLAFFWLALPNTHEVHANITNSQWQLALLACMVLLASTSNLFVWHCFDIATISLSCLTGPFCILLTPIAAINWWIRRSRWAGALSAIFVMAAFVQGAAIINTSPSTRVHGVLGATPLLFFRILDGQVFLGALLGVHGVTLVNMRALPTLLLLGIGGMTLVGYALFSAPLELRLFVIFAASVFISSLISPMAIATVPQWQQLQLPFAAVRYWFIPLLAFVTIMFWMTTAPSPRVLRYISIALLSLMSIGIVHDWRDPSFPDLKFAQYAQKFSEVPYGSTYTIPLNPTGWSMRLVKH